MTWRGTVCPVLALGSKSLMADGEANVEMIRKKEHQKEEDVRKGTRFYNGMTTVAAADLHKSVASCGLRVVGILVVSSEQHGTNPRNSQPTTRVYFSAGLCSTSRKSSAATSILKVARSTIVLRVV